MQYDSCISFRGVTFLSLQINNVAFVDEVAIVGR